MDKRKQTKKQGKEEQYEVLEDAPLLVFLLNQTKGRSRNNVKSLLGRKQVRVNGKAVSQFDYPLKKGLRVSIVLQDEKRQVKKAGIAIMYEDDAVIVVNKPAGLLSMASDKEKVRTAYHYLTDYVREQDRKNRVFIVHRLDRDTSGLMLFAKTESVKEAFQENWKDMMVERSYTALVHGTVSKQSGTIKSWLRETRTHMMYSSETPGDGLEAVTHYQVVQAGRNYSLLQIELETGRKNQIRVHMKDMGHSIVGDKMYGSTENPLSRLCLHAHLLAFRHPVSGEVLRFENKSPFEGLMRT